MRAPGRDPTRFVRADFAISGQNQEQSKACGNPQTRVLPFSSTLPSHWQRSCFSLVNLLKLMQNSGRPHCPSLHCFVSTSHHSQVIHGFLVFLGSCILPFVPSISWNRKDRRRLSAHSPFSEGKQDHQEIEGAL